MAFEFDENPPTSYHYLVALVTPQKLEDTPKDYTWLEKYIPYNVAGENGLHWFIRFK